MAKKKKEPVDQIKALREFVDVHSDHQRMLKEQRVLNRKISASQSVVRAAEKKLSQSLKLGETKATLVYRSASDHYVSVKVTRRGATLTIAQKVRV